MSSPAIFRTRKSPADPDPVIVFDGVRIGFDESDVLRGVSFRVFPVKRLCFWAKLEQEKPLPSNWPLDYSTRRWAACEFWTMKSR